MQALETYEIDGLRVEIYPDEDCTSPREWDNLAEIRGSHRSYLIGDGEPEPRHLEALQRGGLQLLERYLRLCEGVVAFVPVGMLDHSGVTFYAGGGSHWSDSAGWDSGTVGYSFVTRKRCEELGVEVENAEAGMVAELKEYDSWSGGDCYGYVITGEDGDEVDSCGGFIGYEYAVEEAKSTAKALAPGEVFVPEFPVGETLAAL